MQHLFRQAAPDGTPSIALAASALVLHSSVILSWEDIKLIHQCAALCLRPRLQVILSWEDNKLIHRAQRSRLRLRPPVIPSWDDVKLTRTCAAYLRPRLMYFSIILGALCPASRITVLAALSTFYSCAPTPCHAQAALRIAGPPGWPSCMPYIRGTTPHRAFAS